jgi:hypothetical protein
LGSRPQLLHQGVLELGALGQSLQPTFSVWLHPSPFLRELFKNIEVQPLSQALFSPPLKPIRTTGIPLAAWCFRADRAKYSKSLELPGIDPEDPPKRHRATHKYQRLTGANAPEPLRLTGN